MPQCDGENYYDNHEVDHDHQAHNYNISCIYPVNSVGGQATRMMLMIWIRWTCWVRCGCSASFFPLWSRWTGLDQFFIMLMMIKPDPHERVIHYLYTYTAATFTRHMVYTYTEALLEQDFKCCILWSVYCELIKTDPQEGVVHYLYTLYNVLWYWSMRTFTLRYDQNGHSKECNKLCVPV